MKCTILHESSGRLRVHVRTVRMTPDQADRLEYFLSLLPGVRRASVNDRTGNARVFFEPEKRESVVEALASFDLNDRESALPDHTGRALKKEYEDKLFCHVTVRILTRCFLPDPLRTAWTIFQALPYLKRGLISLLSRRMDVAVLDMTSMAVSMLKGDFQTAGSIRFMLRLGEIIEEWTHKKSISDLAEAMSLGVDKVWTLTESGEEVLASVSDIRPGDWIIIRTGSQIPLDGEVVRGEAMVNQSSLTGESEPVRKVRGASVYGGTIVEAGDVTIRVRNAAGSGRYDQIIRIIEESENLKSSAEARSSQLADRLVPYTLGATVLTYLLTGNANRAISILMVDFCCALKLSMPIAVLSAMREAGDHHMAVKGGKFLEAAAEAETIVFDKTGTLTYASPRVSGVVPFGGWAENEVLRLAACLEEHFPHSIANAVVREAEARGLMHEERHSRVEYLVAHGIASEVDGMRVLIGSHHFIFEDESCQISPEDQERYDGLPDDCSHLYLAEGGKLIAVILVEDPIRKEAPATIAALRRAGFTNIVMMTGDSEKAASAAARVGADRYFSEVLPEDKAAFIREEHARGRKVIMVGDGINDSPALSAADAGIAISTGAAIAREIADITIEGEALGELLVLRRLSQRLMERIRRNYREILGFNSFLILLGALGLLQPTVTALLHNGSTLVISLYSMTNLLHEGQERQEGIRDEMA